MSVPKTMEQENHLQIFSNLLAGTTSIWQIFNQNAHQLLCMAIINDSHNPLQFFLYVCNKQLYLHHFLFMVCIWLNLSPGDSGLQIFSL